MPIYEYRCQECQQTFEEWQKDFAERQVPCPVCGGKADRLISSTSFVLKGGGWYSDLYSKPGSSSTVGTDTKPSSPASPSAPKADAAPSATASSSGGSAN